MEAVLDKLIEAGNTKVVLGFKNEKQMGELRKVDDLEVGLYALRIGISLSQGSPPIPSDFFFFGYDVVNVIVPVQERIVTGPKLYTP